MMMPWTKRRAQQREETLRGLTGWDLENLNRAIACGEVEIVPSEAARRIVTDLAQVGGYSLQDVVEMFRSISQWRYPEPHDD